jgi:flagellar hook-associated protein 1 FlgK
MPGLTTSLSIATQALLVQQSALQVATNNIANANTPGYSREVLDLAENPPLPQGSLWFGTGVSAEKVESIRDRLLELRIYDETQRQGNAQAQSTALQQLEALFSDPTKGIGADLTAFFNSINQLSTDPTSIPLRQSVLTAANNLANDFHNTVSQVTTIRHNLDLTVKQSVDQINQLTTQIAALNRQLAPLEQLGQDAGALEDQRNELIRQLSQVTGLLVVQTEHGETLATSNGVPLVVGTQSFALTVAPDVSGAQHIFAQGTDITSTFTGGQLGGLLAVRDQSVPNVLSDLDELAGGLASNFNAAHHLGFDLAGNQGQDFFAPAAPGAGAADAFQVLITDPSAIAASSDGSPGSNGNLANLLAVRDQKLPSGATPIDDYSTLIFNLGNWSLQAQAQAAASQTSLQQLASQRDAVSGVSIDEEATNLIRFQQAYQAAARVISTVNDLTQVLFNITTTTG